MEMIKGIKGHGYHDELVVPIIENTAHEAELVESLTEAVLSFGLACHNDIYCFMLIFIHCEENDKGLCALIYDRV